MLVEQYEGRWQPADERALREQVERIVDEHFGGSEIVALEREPSRFVGSYDCYAVSVELASGAAFRIFLKVFGFTRQSKDQPEERRDRELRVYRDLLAGADLGTPRFYGSVWDAADQRFWLLIELVDGTPLDEPSAEFAEVAAGWLGRLHGYFAEHPERLAASAGLPRMDASYFHSRADQALADVARLAPRASARLESIVPRYRAAIPAMTAGPATLVHGGYIPWHLMIDRECQPPRVCVIDWELATLGCGLYDLAFFVDDAEENVVARACQVYREAGSKHGAPAVDSGTLHHAVQCFRLHRVFDWLGRSVEKQVPEDKIDWLLDRAEQRSAGLEA